MSSALAIAAVTAVLKDLLDNTLIDHAVTTPVGGTVTVTALPPDRIKTGNDETTQLNLFLYHVTPNPGWRNNDLPSRDGRGERLTNPPLALDLHYLLTAYGAKDFHAEIVLGYAMQLLHETPVLTRDAIRKALSPTPVSGGGGLSPSLRTLGTSDLADQVEQIKICPEALSTDEVSKLWSAFQTHYRPTAAYQASVVLIQSRRATKLALPVRERRLHVMPFQPPMIEAVSPQVAMAGSQLIIQGQNLKGDVVKVSFGTMDVDPDTISESHIEVTLPAVLLAGVNTVQVAHQLNFGTTQEPHRGFESNVAAFMLAPRITTPTTPPISVARGSSLALSLNPAVGRSQRVRLLVGDSAILLPARPPSAPATATTLSFSISTDFPTGTFLLRVEVDGAQSPLEVDTNPASPTFNQYIGPRVTIT